MATVNIQNPLQNLNLPLPEEGEIFRMTGNDFSVYKMLSGGKVLSLGGGGHNEVRQLFNIPVSEVVNAGTFETGLQQRGINFRSLPEYNPGDVNEAFNRAYGYSSGEQRYISAIQKYGVGPSVYELFKTLQPAPSGKTITSGFNPAEFSVGGQQVTPQTFVQPGTQVPTAQPTATQQTTVGGTQIPKVGDIIPGTNLRYEQSDISNLSAGGQAPTTPPVAQNQPSGVSCIQTRPN